MARIDTLANFLEDVATKIRSKTGSQSTITPANYDTEIEKIVFKPNISPRFGYTGFPGGYDTINLKNLDTTNLTNLNNMFINVSVLTIDVSNFNTSNCTSMTATFRAMKRITSLDVSNFDTSKVSTMTQMFSQCSNLETITFGNNFTFESMTTGSTTVGMYNMFSSCTKLDNDTLNAILHICTTTTENYTGTKTLAYLGINDTFDNYANIPNLSNYQDFLDAGWTIS